MIAGLSPITLFSLGILTGVILTVILTLGITFAMMSVIEARTNEERGTPNP